MLKPDGWLYHVIDRGTNALLLGLLWILCCLPAVTAGAATCACYRTAQKCILKNEGPFFATFFRTFRANFKQATVLGLFWELLIAAFFIGASYAGGLSWDGLNGSGLSGGGVLYNALLIAVILCAALFFWNMALIARFENKTFVHLRNSVLMAVKHLGATLLLLFCLVLTIFGVFAFFPLIFVLPVATMLIWAARLERLLQKFRYIEEKERK
ncbi:MAG: DUF624 domain-containing protein [Firmicutes bacterium]|nr:DUF624 domain-containing protein [Bacillota bacterium]